MRSSSHVSQLHPGRSTSSATCGLRSSVVSGTSGSKPVPFRDSGAPPGPPQRATTGSAFLHRPWSINTCDRCAGSHGNCKRWRCGGVSPPGSIREAQQTGWGGSTRASPAPQRTTADVCADTWCVGGKRSRRPPRRRPVCHGTAAGCSPCHRSFRGRTIAWPPRHCSGRRAQERCRRGATTGTCPCARTQTRAAVARVSTCRSTAGGAAVRGSAACPRPVVAVGCRRDARPHGEDDEVGVGVGVGVRAHCAPPTAPRATAFLRPAGRHRPPGWLAARGSIQRQVDV